MRRHAALHHLDAVKHKHRFSGNGLSLKEGAAIIGCSPRTLARHIERGHLAAYNAGNGRQRRTLRITREALERFRSAVAYDASDASDS